jgi:hypothetical protein
MDQSVLIRDVTDALRRNGISFDVLSNDSSGASHAVAWLKKFPIEPWGRIGWNGVEAADCRQWSSWESMLQTFRDLLDLVRQDPRDADAPILLIWFSATLPILRVPFAALETCGAEILDEDFDVWILCPSRGWCIENYHEGELCFGRLR